MGKWRTESCEQCGGDIYVHEEWARSPRFCKPCREERAAKWYDKSCRYCGGTLRRVCVEWNRIPDFHKECAWTEKPCKLCGHNIRIHRLF